MEQIFYLKKLKPIAADFKWDEFLSKRMQITWTTNTHPDLCVDISQLSPVNLESFEERNEEMHKATQ